MTPESMLVDLWLLPLIGAVLAWAFGPQLRARAGALCTAVLGISFVLTIAAFGAARTPAGSTLGIIRPW